MLKSIGGEITAQELNDNFSYLDSEMLKRGELHYVSVLDYGAVGDGVVDDTAAIQSAIDNNPNAIIFFPFTGNPYLVSEPILVPARTILRGERAYWNSESESVVIKKTTNNGPSSVFTRTFNGYTDDYNKDAIILIDHANDTYSVGNIIENIMLVGDDTSRNGYGIYAPRNAFLQIKNVHAMYCDNGFYTHNTWMSKFDMFTSRYGDRGVRYANDGSNNITGTSSFFNNCFMSYMDSIAYDFYGLIYSTLSACGADNVKTAYKAEQSDITLNSCGAELANEAIDNWASRVTVNSMRTLSMNGGNSGTTAYIKTRQSGRTVFNACELKNYLTPGGSSSYNIICDNGGKIIFNLTPKPTGATSNYISYSGGATIVENDGVNITKTDSSGTKTVQWA